MTSGDPIRTDASTIHRSLSDSETGHATDADPITGSEVQTEGSNLSEIEEAKTIIRRSPPSGSSPSNDSNWSRSNRTPASVAGVLLGHRLNHFLLEEFIGGGGMGAVFRARDEQLDRVVAIKVIPFVGNDADLKRRFRNEAQSAAKLDHPRIAKVFDVGTDDDWHYIVFEYIEGINIRDLVSRDGVLSIEDAVFYTSQLAEAISHASQRGIVHRDIKPSNVLIGEGDCIKLVDMGLARSDNLDLTEDMTASGVTLGTFDYISPEQANDPRDADVRSDLYSLGCTLYFMLTGQPPYPGGTMLQKLMHHGKTPPPDVRLIRDEVSDDLAAVIRRMLAKQPEDRYQHAEDLIADLHEVAYREDLQRVQAIASVRVASSNELALWLQKHTPWLVAVSLLILVAGGLSLSSELAREKFPIPVPKRTSVLSLTANARTDDAPTPPPIPDINPTLPPALEFGLNDLNRNPNSPLVSTERENAVLMPNLESPSGASTEPRSVSDPPRIRDLPIPEELSRLPLPPSQPLFTPTKPRAEEVKALLIRVERTPNDRSPNDAMESNQIAIAASLEEAIELADELDVNRIELAEKQISCGPMVIDRDGLVISSVVGGTVVVLETEPENLTRRVEWMDVGSNRIELEGLHLHWTVPADLMGGGCVMSMNPNRLVRLRDSSITIDNPTRHNNIVAFEIDTKSEAANRPAALPMVSMEMSNVCIRGQLTMLTMDVAAELQLRWENGLLAINGRMIDTAGAAAKPLPSARPIQLLLEQVILLAPKGLVRMRLSDQTPYPLQIDREAKNCVFIITPNVPAVEVIGTPALDNTPPLLVLRGEANAYDTQSDLSDVMLQIVDSQGNRRQFPMSLLRSATPSWAEERSSRWAVDWSLERSEFQDVSELLPSDFRQFGAIISGFREKSLSIISPQSADSDQDQS